MNRNSQHCFTPPQTPQNLKCPNAPRKRRLSLLERRTCKKNLKLNLNKIFENGGSPSKYYTALMNKP